MVCGGDGETVRPGRQAGTDWAGTVGLFTPLDGGVRTGRVTPLTVSNLKLNLIEDILFGDEGRYLSQSGTAFSHIDRS